MSGNPFLPTILLYAGIGAVFYFVLFRPQQKQRKTHDTMLKSLQKGDEIVTAGGLVGEVVFIAQQNKDAVSMDDRITIKSGETRLLVERGRIAKVSRTVTTPEAKA